LFDNYAEDLTGSFAVARKLNGACIGAFVRAAEANVDSRSFLNDHYRRKIKQQIDPSVDPDHALHGSLKKKFERLERMADIRTTFGEAYFCDTSLKADLQGLYLKYYERVVEILDALGLVEKWRETSMELTGQTPWEFSLQRLTTDDYLEQAFPTPAAKIRIRRKNSQGIAGRLRPRNRRSIRPDQGASPAGTEAQN